MGSRPVVAVADDAAPEDEASPSQAPATLALFFAFLRLGLTAFGGPAMIAQLRDAVVRRRRWLDGASFDDGVVLAQSLPGATAMQVAAWVGLRMRGPAGALATYVGFGLPAFALMLGLSAWYARAQALPSVLAVMNGLQIVVVALIAHAGWIFGRPSLRSAPAVAVAAGATALYAARVSPFAVIVASAAAGLVLLRVYPPASPSQAAVRGVGVRALRWAVLGGALAAGLAIVRVTDPRLFRLSTLMLRVNLFAFGGGFSSLPLMHQEIVTLHRWMSDRTFMDGIALGQVTPGPISITATFVGYQLSGLVGGTVATIAMFTPSFAVLLATAPHFERLRSSAAYTRAAGGVAAGFVGMLAVMAFRFAQGVAWSPAGAALGAGTIVALLRRIDVLWIVLAAVLVSLLVR